MQLAIEDREGGLQLARVSGELDTFAAQGFRERFTLLGRQDRVVVDLQDISFVDSAGLHALFSVGRAAKDAGACVVFVVPPDSPVRRVVDLVQLAHVSPVCDTVDEAISRLPEPTEPDGGLSPRRAG